MNKKIRRTISISIFVLIILVFGTIVAGAVAKSTLKKQYPAPGQLVDVGGYKMHIHCIGQGSPTVILESGSVEFSVNWVKVQPEIAKTTRVCSYDRAGFGWSEPSPHPRTAKKMTEELHTLLANANVQGPYVLVGHSMGGVLMRVYAHNNPDQVAGMVLVDSAHEEQFIRYPKSVIKTVQDYIGQFHMLGLLGSTGITALVPQLIPNPNLPDDAYAQYQAVLATTGFFEANVAELTALEESYAEAIALQMTNFQNAPFIVLSRGLSDATPILTESENQQLWEIWQQMQSDLAALSPESIQIIADQSGHNIQLDQPDLVIDAIRQVIEETP